MIPIVIALFVIGYLAIVFEHPLKLDKTVPALLMGALIWAMLGIGFNMGYISIIDAHDHVLTNQSEAGSEGFNNNLLHHFGKTAEILIFLIGAMTIVEIIDLHKGFSVFKSLIKTTNKRKLLWIIGILGFFLSAIIDNLTTVIVLVSILRKLVPIKTERLWYVALIIIAANAGGAWSPIGDVTTTMLWIGNKVTAVGLSEYLILPSLLSFAIPFLIASFLPVFRGNIQNNGDDISDEGDSAKSLSSRTMLLLGLGSIVFVPIFKTITHLPPYVGMMLSLAIVWLVSEYIHPEEDFTEERRQQYSAHKALSRIEFSSILFFLGILMAVAGLESLVFGTITKDGSEMMVGTLRYFAETMNTAIPDQNIVVILLGIASAIIDNVPLVAAAMGMYDQPIDSDLWHFIAYAAGTGGSMLVIGSAAGVAAMGMENIDFIWYLKKITWLAFLGFLAGAFLFIFLAATFHA